jgi:hypothetical protein
VVEPDDETRDSAAVPSPPDDDEQPSDQDEGAAPTFRLTLGQRILTALPRLGGTHRDAGTDDRPAGPTAGASSPSPRADEHSAGDRADNGRRSAESGDEHPTRQRKGKSPSGMSKEELEYSIKRIDDRERLMGMLMAPLGLGIATFLLINAPPMTAHRAKGQLSHATLVTLGVSALIISVVVFVAALTRRRSFLGFSLVFLGLPVGFPLLVPFWIVGGWMILRAYRWQRELGALGGGPAARGRATTSSKQNGDGRRASPKTSDSRSGGSARRRRADRKAPTPKGPDASKRYTPPKPTRPRPPAPS